MKKLFLTSGLVLCMACPAFATNVTGQGNECVEPTLGVDHGTASLQAIWNANSYKIKYYGGTAGSRAVTATAMPDKSVSYDQTNVQLDANTYAITGYTFNGWKGDFNKDGTAAGTAANPTASYEDEDTIAKYQVVGDLTLTAQWTANSYDVNYNKGAHAAAGVNNYTHTDGATYDAGYTAKTFAEAGMTAADGYTFRGWSTSSAPTVTKNGNTYTVSNAWTGANPWTYADDDFTVYAAYSANEYTISYDCGSPIEGATAVTTGSVTPEAQTVNMDGEYTLAANTCVLQGYTFAGWSCPNLPGSPTLPADAQTKTMFAAEATGTYSYAGSVTCTAQWTRNNITLQWNKNGADSADIANTSCTYDGTITLPTQPTKTGYTFGGWEVVVPAAPAQNGGGEG